MRAESESVNETLDADQTLVENQSINILKDELKIELFSSSSKSKNSSSFLKIKKPDIEIKLKKDFLKTDRELNLLINSLNREKLRLSQANKILTEYNKEIDTQELINKWRDISTKEMNYLLNMTLLKIGKMGGYEEFLKKELESEKDKISFSNDNYLEQEMEEYLDSAEFEQLDTGEQEEIRQTVEQRIQDFHDQQEQRIEKLEMQFEKAASKEFDMKELSKRLNVNYDLIFPSY